MGNHSSDYWEVGVFFSISDDRFSCPTRTRVPPKQKQMKFQPVLELLLRKAGFCRGAAAFTPGMRETRTAEVWAIEGLIAQAVFADESRGREDIPQEHSGPTGNTPEASPRRAKGVSAGAED